MKQKIRNYLEGINRQKELLIVSALAMLAIVFSNFPVMSIVLKLATVTLFGAVGYYLHRAAYRRELRPHHLMAKAFNASESDRAIYTEILKSVVTSRAIVIAASIVGAGLVIT